MSEKDEFDKWFKTAGWDTQYEMIARSAWNGAIAAARDCVSSNFDEHEPWITPREIGDLSSF